MSYHPISAKNEHSSVSGASPQDVLSSDMGSTSCSDSSYSLKVSCSSTGPKNSGSSHSNGTNASKSGTSSPQCSESSQSVHQDVSDPKYYSASSSTDHLLLSLAFLSTFLAGLLFACSLLLLFASGCIGLGFNFGIGFSFNFGIGISFNFGIGINIHFVFVLG